MNVVAMFVLGLLIGWSANASQQGSFHFMEQTK